jgi:hypothetical protein
MLYHNKKRNVGLLNEFFARYIANALVEQNGTGVEKATDLYKKYFLGNTEISKEWKLFRALYETNLTSKETANGLIGRVKSVSGNLNSTSLEAEKTKLIHEVNNTLGDKEFFKRPVGDYKLQASIQVLLNNWREKKLTESLSEMATLEDSVMEHLVRAKIEPKGNSVYLEMDGNQIDKEIDSLVVGLMSEKFNTKFNKELFDEQRQIVSNYVFSDSSDVSRGNLKNTLESVRTRTLRLVESALSTKKIGKENLSDHLSKKFTGIKNLLLNEYKDTSNLNDDTITFYMTLVKLEKELAHE